MLRRKVNLNSFDCDALAQVKEHEASKNIARCFQCSYSLGEQFDDVGRQSDLTWISRPCGDGIVLGLERWRCTFDPTFESGKRRKARGASLFNDEEVNDINPLTDPIAFDTPLQEESLSEDVREIIRMKY